MARAERTSRRRVRYVVALVAATWATAVFSDGPTDAPAPRGAGSRPPGAWVRLRDRRVFEILACESGKPPAVRARESSEALARAVLQPGEAGATGEDKDGAALLRVGAIDVLRIVRDDAAAAGEVSPAALAATLAVRVDGELRAERRRLALQSSVIAFSLLVVSALMAFLLVRRIAVLERLVERWLAAEPRRVPAFAVGGVEVVSCRGVRGAIDVALRGGRILAQVAVIYFWLLFSLSLFEATRDAGERLRGLLLRPAADLVARVGGAIPVLVMLAVAVVAVGILLRAVRLLLESVARGDMHLRWLPADLARPVSTLTRFGIIVLALALAAPLAGDGAGPLGVLGTVALVSSGLAAVPLLASLLAGIPAVFGRRIRVGDGAEVAGRSGRVIAVSLLDIRLADENGGEVRVSHLATLLRPVRVFGGSGVRTRAELVVSGDSDPEQVRSVLLQAAGGEAAGAAAELTSLDAFGARWCVRGPVSDLGARAAAALRAAGVRLGGRP